MRTRIAVVLALAMLVPAVAVSAQGVDLTDLSRQAAASQWMQTVGTGLNPWGDYSDPRVEGPDVQSCFEGWSLTTSYGTAPAINIASLEPTTSCLMKGSFEGGPSEGAIPMDLMPNFDSFRSFYTFDGLPPDQLAPTGSDVMIFTIDVPQNLFDPSYCEGATTELAFAQKSGTGTGWMVDASFPDDYWREAERVNTLTINNCQMTSTDYVIGDGNQVMTYPGNMLAAVGDSPNGGSVITGMFRLPDGVMDIRPALFHTNQTGNFDSSIVGHVWPTDGMYWSMDDVTCLVDIPEQVQTTTTTVAETTTTTAEVTTTTAAPTTTVAETTPTTIAEDPPGEGGGFPFWILIFLILIGLAIWYWLFGPGKKDEPTPPIDPPTPPVDPPPEEPPTTPGGSIPPELHEDPGSCDWSLYLLTASGEEQIRGPRKGAHECCVYKVQVSSFVHEKEEAVKERQDLKEEGRERASLGHSVVAGMDTDMRTAVRSWPIGEQGAMHGLGDMSEWPIVGPTPGPWPEYFQEKQFEEQLDAAYSSVLHQDTRVTVNFTDGCGKSEHTFKYDSDSEAIVKGTFECTNENTDPTCPIELTAAAMARVEATGNLDYTVDATSHTDVDELPVKIEITGPNAEFRRADADSHRHDTDRDRDVWEIKDFGHDHGSLNSKSWESVITNRAEAHAGLMIPQAMWPTTDRVTAFIELDTKTEFGLNGVSKPAHSPTSNCCAHDGVKCFCAPSFELTVGYGNIAKLTVDGETRNISNADTHSTSQTMIWD